MRNNPQRPTACTLLVVVSMCLAFLGYGALLLDWVQAYRTDAYVHQPVVTVGKTAVHLLYLYGGIRFLSKRIRFF